MNSITKESHYVIPNSSLNGRAFTVHLPLPVGLENPAEVICVAEDGTRERLTGSYLEIGEHWVDMTGEQLCTFIVNARPTNAATIGGISYGTLQEAVNAAAGGATITLEQDCTEKITVSGKSLTIDLNGKAYDSDLVGIGANCTKTVSGDKIIVTYTTSSTSGNYLVSVASSKNGKVTVSPGRANKGGTVTITVKPDEGYALSTLTVTDKNGNGVKVTYKSEGKYTFTMPAGKVTIEAAFAEIREDLPFTDVSRDAYYYDAVLWAVENGVTNGTTATTFSPDETVTRAQMVTFLWRAYGAPKAVGGTPFADVNADAYYYDAVLWAVASGVTNGTTDTSFSPNAPVTRAQAVTFQWRAAGTPVVPCDSFVDVEADAYYTNAVAWAVAEGVTNGTTDTTFEPNAAVSRAQAVTFLYRELA